jgi:hypothetical protein
MHLVVGNRPSKSSGEVRFFRFMSAQGILGDQGGGGVRFEPQEPMPKPDRADDREPETRRDGEVMPPDSLDPKDPKNPASKPQGTTDDQVANMENEGQAQEPVDPEAKDPTTTLPGH